MITNQAVNVCLSYLRPLAIMFPDHIWAVAQDVGQLFEARSVLEQAGGKSMAEAMRVGTLYAGLFEYRSERALRVNRGSRAANIA